jgi:Holliday junction resolvase-like predicted endonuclease
VLDERRHGRRGGRLLVSRSTDRRELVFCELRIEPLAAWQDPAGELGRRQLRRAALAWLAVNPAVEARTLRFDRLTVFIGRDGMPIGLEHVPQAF